MEAFDYNPLTEQLVIGGQTADTQLLAGYSTLAYQPALVMYQGISLQPVWGKFSLADEYVCRGLAISKDGKYVVGTAIRPTFDAKIIIVKALDGSLQR